MQLKLRQIILFFIACIVLAFSGVAGGSLLAVAALLQLSILIKQMPFTKQMQLAQLKLFLISLPVLFFWGGVHSFVFIYLKEKSFSFALMALSISMILSFIAAFQLIFTSEYLVKNDFSVSPALSEAFNDIKQQKNRLLQMAGLIFIFSFVPFFASDWKLVFSLTATVFFLNRSQLMKAI